MSRINNAPLFKKRSSISDLERGSVINRIASVVLLSVRDRSITALPQGADKHVSSLRSTYALISLQHCGQPQYWL